MNTIQTIAIAIGILFIIILSVASYYAIFIIVLILFAFVAAKIVVMSKEEYKKSLKDN